MDTLASRHQQNLTKIEQLLRRQHQKAKLKQIYMDTDGNLSPPTPPSLGVLERMYKVFVYKKTPKRKKPANKRCVLRFLVSRDAKRLEITDAVVISEVTDMLFKAATDQ